MLTRFKSIFRPRKQHQKEKSMRVVAYTKDMKRISETSGHPTTTTTTTTTTTAAAANTATAHSAKEKRSSRVPAAKEIFDHADSSEKQKAEERAAKLVEEERRRKHQLPSYDGLEQYEIIKKLGDGAFSNVYKARDKTSGRKVAIKVVRKRKNEPEQDNHLHPSMKKKPRATERANILKEVQIMRNVDHPNIVQLIDFVESDEFYYLVLELCEGGELFHRIVKLTYLSEPLARHVITQVAQAVRYLHEECGVVHRDIKPENILFDPIPFIPTSPLQRHRYPFDENKEDEGVFTKGFGGGGIGQVKIADFGLSKVIWDSSTWTPCGTVGYTAPEIVRDQRYSKSVDMWAMGCVLYTLLCGFPPFYDESIHALTDKVARGQYAFLSPWWDPISDSAKDLISHLLCVDPTKRYTIDQFLSHPWITGKEPTFVTRSSSIPSRPSPATTISTLSDLDSPDSARKRKDAFSPGVPSIKEILDITYAVQRMGEEKTWRGATVNGLADQPHYEMDEEEEDDAMLADSANAIITMNKDRKHRRQSIEQTSKGASGSSSPSQQQAYVPLPNLAIAPKKKQAVNHRYRQQQQPPGGFQLNMDNATLLKNRRQAVC